MSLKRCFLVLMECQTIRLYEPDNSFKFLLAVSFPWITTSLMTRLSDRSLFFGYHSAMSDVQRLSSEARCAFLLNEPISLSLAPALSLALSLSPVLILFIFHDLDDVFCVSHFCREFCCYHVFSVAALFIP